MYFIDDTIPEVKETQSATISSGSEQMDDLERNENNARLETVQETDNEALSSLLMLSKSNTDPNPKNNEQDVSIWIWILILVIFNISSRRFPIKMIFKPDQ